MAIDPKGSPCSDSANPLASSVIKSSSIGVLALARITVHEDVGVNAPVDVTDDFVTYSGSQPVASPWAFSPSLSTLPAGTCTVYPGLGDLFAITGLPGEPAPSLNVGSQIQISGPGGQQTGTLINSAAVLGSYASINSLPNQLFLAPGTYSLSSSGSTTAGAFNTSLTVPSPLSWTNRDQITGVSRSQPLLLNWSGSSSGQTVAILGIGSDLPTNSSAMFLCIAPAGAASFSVPAEVLSALPPAQPNVLASKNVIFLMSTTPGPLTAKGLGAAVAAATYITGKTVIFQ